MVMYLAHTDNYEHTLGQKLKYLVCMSYICHRFIPEHKGYLCNAVRGCDSSADSCTCCHVSAAPSGDREAKM